VPDSCRGKGFTFDGPAVYRIVVQGRVEEGMSGRLGGMKIERTSVEDGAAVTTLLGPVRDQAALNGVLNTVYELHLPVLSVEKLAHESSRQT
jgi:hypothetical protein